MNLEAQRILLSGMMAGTDIGIKVSMPNNEFNVPVNETYGEFFIVNGPKAVTIGGEGKGRVRNRYPGFVQLTIWIPDGKGTKPGTIPAGKFASIFQHKVRRDSAGQSYRFQMLQPFNATAKAGYSCMVVRVPFTVDAVEDIQISV